MDISDRILRPKEAAKFLGVSRTTLWRLEQKNQLPPKRIISRGPKGRPGVVGWLESEIYAFRDELETEMHTKMRN